MSRDPVDAREVSELTEENLVLWEDNVDDYLVGQQYDRIASDINQPQLTLVGWNNDFS